MDNLAPLQARLKTQVIPMAKVTCLEMHHAFYGEGFPGIYR